jgi:hypothetical protein
MRILLSLIVIIYLVGVGVALSPTLQTKDTATAPDLAARVVQALPNAVAWPVWAFRRTTEHG